MYSYTHIGVPVRHQRYLACKAQHAMAAFVLRFLMLWASSARMQMIRTRRTLQ